MEEEARELYFEVRSGRRNFPHGFWKGAIGKSRAKAILRYVVDSELRIPRTEIPKKLRLAVLKKRRLMGMISQAFDHSFHKAILETYPGVCKPWEFAKNPGGYWRGSEGRTRCRKAVRWLVEEKLQLCPDDAPKKLRMSDFQEHGLSWMLTERSSTIVEAVMDAYPGMFRPWDFHSVPNKFWKGEEGKRNARAATRWLIEEKLRLSQDEIPGKIDYKAFKEAGLSGMLTRVYRGSHSEAVMDAYPDRHKPWQFRSVPKGFWQGAKGIENAKRATRWLVAKLSTDLEGIPIGLTSKDFLENGLNGMLYNIYGGSVVKAAEDAFPKQDFKPWQFQQVPHRYWEGERGREHARDATRWLVEDRLGLDPSRAPGRLERKHFRENGLWGMLNRVHNNSEYSAFNDAYPGLCKKWEFGSVHNNYWSGEGGRNRRAGAVRWLIESKLEMPLEDVPRFLTHRHFDENDLCGLFSNLYHGSVYEALCEAYPGRFTQEELLEGALKRVNFHQRLGRKVEALLLRYLSEYCEENGIPHEEQKEVATGFVDFWMDEGIAFDITSSRTREGIRRKWKKKRYQEDSRVKEFRIVVVAGSFSSLDYRELNKESPQNVSVIPYGDLFHEFGLPSANLRLELEALALMTPKNAPRIRDELEKAITRGQKHLYSTERLLKMIQTRLSEF